MGQVRRGEAGTDQTTEDIICTCFKKAEAVLHVAGCVCLMDNAGLLHNAHVVATANVVRCARLAGARGCHAAVMVRAVCRA